jgi:hypothetical protein
VPILLGAAAIALVVVLALAAGQYLGGRDGTTGVSPNPPPAASPSPTAPASPTPTGSPTPSPTQAGTRAFENVHLGYRVTLPEPWRRSECLSALTRENPMVLGHDLFTVLSEPAEYESPPGATQPGGAWQWGTVVELNRNPDRVSSMDWIRQGRAGETLDQRVEAATVAGLPAAKLTNGARYPLAYYVAVADRMYVIAYTGGDEPKPAGSSPESFEAIVGSFAPFDPRPIPAPTPVPSQPPEAAVQLADALAAAFARSDADALAPLIVPVCWFTSAYYQSEGVSTTRERLIAGFREEFSRGLQVSVEARPIRTDPPMRGTYWVWSTWRRPGQPDQNGQLVFSDLDGRWYWSGAFYNAPR